MTRTSLPLPLLLAAAFAAGCGSSSSTTTSDMATGAMPDLVASGPPAAPTLGAQIDRMGRSGVNTALTDPFDTIQGMTPDQVKDAYNAAADPTMWATQFRGSATAHSYIAGNLAILDGADTVCGNQAGFAASGSYDLLAGALADDRLLVNTGSTTCQLYLGVEAAVLGIPNTDCGGRTPLENTIDETYSLLIIGMPSGITNGITKDAEGNPNATSFPFLGAPN